MTEFEYDEQWLPLLWAVLAVAALGLYGIWQRRRALRLFATGNLLPQLAPPVTWARNLTRLGLVTLALVALVGAAIDPRWGAAEQQVVRRDIDVMVVLDVSRSMLARDIAPDRLERAKLSIRDDLLPALGGDRIGLITFAGVPSVKCPLTSDYGFFRLALEDVTTESAPRGGTLIGDALRKAADAFPDKLETNKVVLLITDGEDHESYPIAAASALWEDHQIPVIAVALGDEREGARIPIGNGRGESYLEYEGEVVWSRANFDDLRRVGSLSPLSEFVPVGTRNFDLGEIYQRVIVPKIDFREELRAEEVPLPSRYQPFAFAALALLLVDSFLRDARRRPAVAAAAARRGRGVAA
jgi:Ca-activated chloride channel family protein